MGSFPAKYCLKISGYKAGTREQVVIRTCTVNKLLDSDSFISSFTLKLDNENTSVSVVSGMIASCKDDGCNSAPLFKSNVKASVTFVILLKLAVYVYFYIM